MTTPPQVPARLGGFIQELQGLRFQVPEDEKAVARAALFAPRLIKALDEAMALLEASQDHYERQGRAAAEQVSGLDSLLDIGRLISSEIAGQQVADILFVARGELKGVRQDLLAAIDQEDFLRVASSCDSGLRTLKRVLVSVESTICEYEGLEQPIRHWIDLQVSLETRRLYAQLRREILGGGSPSESQLTDRLAAVHDRLNGLRERDLYPLLRFDDRVTMRELRQRIGRWVAGEPHDLVAGRRLWQDLAGFAELLEQVNHRQELRQHDRALARRAYHLLFGRAAHATEVGDDLLAQLAALAGLDDELDALLAGGHRHDLDRWRFTLSRLLHRLSTTAEGVPASPSWPEE